MNVDLGLWGKLTRVIILLLVLAALLGVVLWYLPLFQQNERMRKEILRIDSQIKQQEELARQQELAVKALRNDPKTVERTAREKLGYAKPGETVIYFEQPAASTNKSSENHGP
ncbi:MAG: septum formation initiator family protein [Verrucomicrobiota bacterium]